MRNIEVMAAEEEGNSRRETGEKIEKFFFFLSLVLGVAGWFYFARSPSARGPLLIVAGVLAGLVGLGGLQAFRFSFSTWLLALLAGAGAFTLYDLTKCPSFYWGKDPSFWLAVDGGAVVEPAWSPLSYLAAKIICILSFQPLPAALPLVSPVLLGFCVFFVCAQWFSLEKNQSLLAAGCCVLLAWMTALNRPLWNAATLASGTVSGLGLLLFLWQRALLRAEEKRNRALAYLSGLLFSVHPLWGILGLAQIAFEGKQRIGKFGENLGYFGLGFVPYLWIFFRAGRFFPSWGGAHPFLESFREAGTLWSGHFQGDWNFSAALASLGWLFWVPALLVGAYLFSRGRMGMKPLVPFSEVALVGLALAGAVAFYSVSTGTPGATAVFLPVGLVEIGLAGLKKTLGKKAMDFSLKPSLELALGGVVFAAMGLALLPGQSFRREGFWFPQQHALNLLKTLGKKSALVCEEPFEAGACLEARLLEPLQTGSVILEKRFLNRRWFVRQSILSAPDLLFSAVAGRPDPLLRQLIADNQENWEIHWAISELPLDWKGPSAAPLVLTQRFTARPAGDVPPETVQYRYDLSPLLEMGPERGPQFLKYARRYSLGFNAMGKGLLSARNYPGAIRVFERAANLEPDWAEPKDHLAWIYSRQNILEAARLGFEKAVRTLPPRIERLMSELEKSRKGSPGAETAGILDEMIRMNTELSDAQYHLGLVYEKEGRLQDSKALLESSLKLNPRRIEVLISLGTLMEKTGNRYKAEEAFRSVLMMDPQNKDAQKELWKLLNKP